MNLELKEKNEKLLELLEEIEEVRIQVYARDKSIELQQKQVEDLLEELRDSKAVDNDIKILVSKKIAIEEENQRLKKELDEKFLHTHEKQFESNELSLENKSLVDQIKTLKAALDAERTEGKQGKAKVDADRALLVKDLALAKKELETVKIEQA